MLLHLIWLSGPDGAPWYNIPGFEAWRYFNLLLFVGAMVYILRRPVSESLRARRENIRRELKRALEERNAAQAKLAEVEERLARLDAEVETVRTESQRDAEEERKRIAASTEEDARKLREQARREIEGAARTARAELRRFTAEQSVALAEEMIRRDIRPDDDERLISSYVQELGGIKR